MNADFNVGFVDNQSAAEQLFNRASLREFHGEMIQDEIDRALAHFESSIDGLDRAMAKTDRLLQMIAENEVLPEFEASLRKHLSALGVPRLERISLDSRPISTLEDILTVTQAEFAELRDMTARTIEATRELEPAIDKGLFVSTVLEADSRFNQEKIALGFGRGMVETFVSTACHATILAVEDTFPRGFDFLDEPKEEGRRANAGGDQTDDGWPGWLPAGLGAFAVLLVTGYVLQRRRRVG